MTSTHHIVVIHGDAQHAEAAQQYLHQQLGRYASLMTFEQALNEPPEPEALWIIMLTKEPQVEHAARLVQSVLLQDWPTDVILLVDKSAAKQEPHLARLDFQLAGRFCWPEESEELAAVVEEKCRRMGWAGSLQGTTVREEICRRLLRQTPSLLDITDYLVAAASHDVVMLLSGETGSGKTYLAKILHECSPRADQPFMVVACGSLPSNLAESTFFGHFRGSFTGADRSVIGRFAAAGEGTLLLDEIDTLGPKEQASLLRVLETGEFEPIGSNETQRCRARIIAISNVDLKIAVAEGKFRQDLYYRLGVLSLELPPLRDRPQDVVPLARGMVARLARQFRKDLFTLHSDVLGSLMAYPWPGNIRQLHNALQHAVMISSGPELLLRHFPEGLFATVREFRRDEPGMTGPKSRLRGSRHLLERAVILQALERMSYNRAGAARELGISRVTLYKKLKQYGLEDVPDMSQTAKSG
jgi:DNA-binding NtrC family response regulator